MQRIDAGYVYELGDAVRCLRHYRQRQEVPAYEIWGPLTRARQKLYEFLTASVFIHSLRMVHVSAASFQTAIDEVTKKIMEQRLTVVPMIELTGVFEAFDRFEPVLASELSSLTVYLVLPKGAYDVTILVNNGERMFPQGVQMKAPEAVWDIQQGAKALAFELWTAAGFHFHRANEAVLRRYFDHAAGAEMRPKIATMGTLLGKLKELQRGDKNIIAALDNIKEFHRNPISHAGGQNILSAEECLDLVAAVRAAMGYMLEKLPLDFAPVDIGDNPFSGLIPQAVTLGTN
jgi:hypothetical protein